MINRRHFLQSLVYLPFVAGVQGAKVPLRQDEYLHLSDFNNLQEAVEACQNGGAIQVGRGVFEIGNVVIPERKTVHILGIGPGMLNQGPPRYSGQWDYLYQYYYDDFVLGTILRGTINATAPNSHVSLTGIMMVGRGDGVGLDLGNIDTMNPNMPALRDVAFANYEIGLRALQAYSLNINNMMLTGCDIGAFIHGGNLIRLFNVDIMSCRLGMDLKGEINVTGGSVQSCENGIRAWTSAGYIGMIHFEDIKEVSLYLDGYGSKLDPCFFATNSGKAVINGYNNILNVGWGVLTEFTEKSQTNFATLWGPYTDAGWNNRIN